MMFSLYITSILIVASLLVLCVFALRYFRSMVHQQCLEDDDILQRFEAFARLCEEAYGDPSLGAVHAPVEIGGWHFRFRKCYMNGSLWVWEVVKSPLANVHFVFVVRGSHTIPDWCSRDLRLALGMPHFASVLRPYELCLTQCLTELAPDQTKDTNLMFTGHSLGATLAESLHCKCVAGKDKKSHLSSAGCVTFDSPGQPSDFRSDPANGFLSCSIETIWTLNARPNIVNMLYHPIAAHFYSCGLGSELHFEDLAGIPLDTITGALKYIGSALFQTTYGHSLDSISKHIRSRNVRKEVSDHWPSYSGRFFLDIPAPINIIVNNNEVQAGFIELSELPSDSDVIELSKPYKVSKYESYLKFFEQHKGPYALFPFISISGQGKTHTLAKLLNNELDEHLNGSPLQSLVRDGTNNSTLPIVALWMEKTIPVEDGLPPQSVKVYIIDFPGIGEGSFHAGFFGGISIDKGFNDLILPLEQNILYVTVILRELIHGTAALHWKTLKPLINRNIKVTIAFNANSDYKRGARNCVDRIHHYESKFEEGGISIQKPIVIYNANKSPVPKNFNGNYEYRITDLITHLTSKIEETVKAVELKQKHGSREQSRILKYGLKIVPFVPVVGSMKNCYDDVQNGKYVMAGVNAAIGVLEGFTLGGSSLATPWLRPLISGAAAPLAKVGLTFAGNGRLAVVGCSRIVSFFSSSSKKKID